MSALSGIDIALWDLKGKPRSWALGPPLSGYRDADGPPPGRKLGVPIYQLLGGKVRDRLRVYAWIGGDRPSDVVEEA